MALITRGLRTKPGLSDVSAVQVRHGQAVDSCAETHAAEECQSRQWCNLFFLSLFFFFFFAKHIVVGRLIVQHTSNTITCSHSFILHTVYKK